MPATTYRDFLKADNAALRLGSAAIQTQQAAKINETQQYLTWYGDNPALSDYQSGTVVVSASTAVARSSVVDFVHDYFHKPALVRFVTTIGATPTATYAIQGSMDNSTWNNVNYADLTTPGTVVNTNFTTTTATTIVKYVLPGQQFRFLSVNVTADTNVTNTIDITFVT
jgi:hypothetical protein